MIRFILNRDLISTTTAPGTTLLDLLRRERNLKGTKEGCREGDCGACTVLVGSRSPDGVQYRSAASCLLPVGDLDGKHLVTIEGLNGDGLSPVQQAIVDEGATQCGFCTPGIVVALTGFLLTSTSLAMEDALAAVEGNICRCTGYTSILRAIERLVASIDTILADPLNRIHTLVEASILPAYFLDMASRLDNIATNESPKTAHETPVPVAGGTDLFVQQADRLQNHALYFLSKDLRLHGIRIEKDTIIIGATTTVEELKGDTRLRERLPAWERALGLVSSTLIRNRATLAGNIINASPIGDLTILLLALNARLTIRGPSGVRCVSLDAFYRGYKQFDLNEGELVTEIRFPCPPLGNRFNFEKVSRREHLDIASVNTAMLVEEVDGYITKARLSAGGVAPSPLFLTRSSAYLSGKPVSIETVMELTQLVDAEIAPIDDVRGTAHYKRSLLRRLVIAHFVECFPRLALEELLP
ncbi:MAG: FAD binding domain-containing protein [Proteobacteria bacterium]|nr:FAD binding domain-containing protein [Pseudomonadota bacterium]